MVSENTSNTHEWYTLFYHYHFLPLAWIPLGGIASADFLSPVQSISCILLCANNSKIYSGCCHAIFSLPFLSFFQPLSFPLVFQHSCPPSSTYDPSISISLLLALLSTQARPILLISSFINLSNLITPTENLNIFISATSIFLSCLLVIATAPMPYALLVVLVHLSFDIFWYVLVTNHAGNFPPAIPTTLDYLFSVFVTSSIFLNCWVKVFKIFHSFTLNLDGFSLSFTTCTLHFFRSFVYHHHYVGYLSVF